MSAVQLSDFEQKFRDSSDILHDALAGSFVEASKFMSPNGLKVYLDGAGALHAMGKGEDMVISFLEETPMVVREVGESIIGEIVFSIMKMSSQTSSSVLVLMIASLPNVARRMSDFDLLKGYLRLMERMIALAPRGMRPMLNNIDQLTSKLTLGGLRRWVLYGAESFKRDFKAQIAYFELSSAESMQILEQERRGTLFIDNQRKLQFYLRAFYNRDFFLRPTSGDYETKKGLRPYIEYGVMHIPDAYDDYKHASGRIIPGIDCYRAVCAHAAAHIMETRVAFKGDDLNPLQVACISLIEDLRVELNTLKKFPGMKKTWIALHPEDEDLKDLNPFIVDLVDFSRAALDQKYTAKQSFNSDFLKLFIKKMTKMPESSAMSYELGMKYYELLKTETDVKISASALVSTPIMYRDDNRYIWEYEELDWLSEGNDYVPVSQRQVRKNVNIMEMYNELDVETAGDDAQEIWTLESEYFPDELDGVSINEVEGKEPVSEPFHYNEWDYQLQLYRPNWATLYERRLRKGDPELINKILKTHKPIANQLKNAIDRMQPQGLVKLKKQQEGSELDLDACVTALADIRSGITPSDRIYVKKVQHVRDVSVNLLMDLSESTNDMVIGSDKTILELMKESTALLSWAIDKIGDNLTISGFASDSRHDVQYYRFKPFYYSFNDEVKGRLAGIKGGLSTRMGAAIRHAGGDLLTQSSAKKILLILTDGEPADIDVDDPQHLRMDAKKAVEELRSHGIVTFCISLDPNADEYVSRIFGKNRFMVIDNIQKLPERLPQLFISLTK
ncbi:MAG: VWA domain-containing protein [Gammaproteobacteria bacterium]|nr:VWA domain-containing protein [Gammaproteobacteria bacterium]